MDQTSQTGWSADFWASDEATTQLNCVYLCRVNDKDIGVLHVFTGGVRSKPSERQPSNVAHCHVSHCRMEATREEGIKWGGEERERDRGG